MESLLNHYQRVRRQTEALCEPLLLEDYGLQAITETSPVKWHIAHVSWFFETFLLKPYVKGYPVFHPQFEVLFNSYYNAVGEQFPRPNRFLLSRPSVDDVMAYRRHIDDHIEELILNLEQYGSEKANICSRLTLGIHHEQQHQELMLTDIKYNFFQNPLLPAYMEQTPNASIHRPQGWIDHAGGITQQGVNAAEVSFCFDNETPLHTAYLEPFKLADRLVNNAEYLTFIQDGAYKNPLLWLADGWEQIKQHGWNAPLYWLMQEGEWFEFTLHGVQKLDPYAPVTHISYYEACAYAAWKNLRLASEAEWEAVASTMPPNTIAARSEFQPTTQEQNLSSAQLGDVAWQWTQTAYQAYPKYQPAAGALGEYNGKFMSNQIVLKGGSCATPENHSRPSYRNFFYPKDRWQFSGIRLAQSV